MARVLVVDDDVILRAFAVDMLGRAGHACGEAGDGEAALRWMDGHAADLVVTDMFMPKKDGLETLREIRARWPATKVIGISSGWNDFKADDILRMASLMGADAVAGKPLEEARFLALVAEVLAAP
jgi:CheY-like chemotaxis protein